MEPIHRLKVGDVIQVRMVCALDGSLGASKFNSLALVAVTLLHDRRQMGLSYMEHLVSMDELCRLACFHAV